MNKGCSHRFGRWLVLAVLFVWLPMQAQAALIAEARHNDIAYLVEDGQNVIYRFDLANAEFLESIYLSESPRAFAVDDDGLYVAYARRVSRFALDGTGETHLKNTLDEVTGLVLNGNYLLIKFDTSASAYFSIDKTTGVMAESGFDGDSHPDTLVLWEGNDVVVGVAPNVGGNTSLNMAPYSNATGALGSVTVTPLPTVVANSFAAASEVEISGNTAYFDNGSFWDLTAPSYNGYLSARAFFDVDFPFAGEPVVVRNVWDPCAAIAGVTEIVQYDSNNDFVGLKRFADTYTKVFAYDTGTRVNYYVFGLDLGGNLLADSTTSDDLIPFDDGVEPEAVAGASVEFSSFDLDSDNVLLSDDLDTLYLLYQGEGICTSSILRYSISAKQWLPSIPLRWKAEFIRLLRGADPASAADDVIAVGYNEGNTFHYGNKWAFLSFINVGAGELEENAAQDAGFSLTEYPMVDLVATRHTAVAKMVSSDPGGDVLVLVPALAGTRTDTTVTSLNSGGASLIWNPVSESLLGYSGTQLISMGILGESSTTGTFDTFNETAVAGGLSLDGEAVWLSQDGALMLTGFGWLFGYDVGTPGFTQDLPVDALSAEVSAAAWSSFAPAGGNYYLYTLAEQSGNTLVQRWEDAAGYFSPGVDYSALIAGVPKAIFLEPGATEDTVHVVSVNGTALAVTTLASDLGDDGDLGGGVGGEPVGGGGAGGGAGGEANVDDNALIWFTDQGRSSGSLGYWLLLVIAAAGVRRRRA